MQSIKITQCTGQKWRQGTTSRSSNSRSGCNRIALGTETEERTQMQDRHVLPFTTDDHASHATPQPCHRVQAPSQPTPLEKTTKHTGNLEHVFFSKNVRCSKIQETNTSKTFVLTVNLRGVGPLFWSAVMPQRSSHIQAPQTPCFDGAKPHLSRNRTIARSSSSTVARAGCGSPEFCVVHQ